MKIIKHLTNVLCLLLVVSTVSKAQTINIGPDQYAFQYTVNPNFGMFFNATNVQYELRNNTASSVFSIDAVNGEFKSNISFDAGSDLMIKANRYAFRFLNNPGYGLFFNATNLTYDFRTSDASPVLSVNANTGSINAGPGTGLADFHFTSQNTGLGILAISPNSTINDSSALLLLEERDGLLGMGLQYDGTGNELQVWGGTYGSGAIFNHLTVGRNGGVMINGHVADLPSDTEFGVNGKIMCTEVQVDAFPWPDYVFENSYELMDIYELERQIKANRHLPNINSAADIHSDGLNLGEMQRRMMEKIEELVLYTIQQQKEIDQLKQELQDVR